METNAFCISLAACLVLLLAAVAFLIFIVIGVRKGDLGDLSSQQVAASTPSRAG